jgi:hypothetical protein
MFIKVTGNKWVCHTAVEEVGSLCLGKDGIARYSKEQVQEKMHCLLCSFPCSLKVLYVLVTILFAIELEKIGKTA